jgi:predicted GIY-YIG superfamily endonuclease
MNNEIRVGEIFTEDRKPPKRILNCVYKVLVSDGSFYFGSTTNFGVRFRNHAAGLKNRRGCFSSLSEGVTLVGIEILHVGENMRSVEAKFITENKDNPKMLNKAIFCPVFISETEFVSMMVGDFSLKEIALKFQMSYSAITGFLTKLKSKYGMQTTCGLVMYFLRNKLIE